MVDVSSSLGEDRVLWDGCMKRRVPQNTLGRKIDNFCPTYAWTPSLDLVCMLMRCPSFVPQGHERAVCLFI